MPIVRIRRRPLVDGIFIVCFAVASLGAVACIGLKPRDPSTGVAVVFAPWTSREDAFVHAVEAGGRFVRYGAVPFVVIVPETVDFLSRVLGRGAVFVADPQALAGCLLAGSGRKS